MKSSLKISDKLWVFVRIIVAFSSFSSGLNLTLQAWRPSHKTTEIILFYYEKGKICSSLAIVCYVVLSFS